MGEGKNCVVKNEGGNNKYIIYLSNERNFTHTIIDNSATLGEIYLVQKIEDAGYKSFTAGDVVYNVETQTLVTFMRNSEQHTVTGRIILKRTQPGSVTEETKLYLVDPGKLFGCDQVPSLDSEGLDCIREYSLNDSFISRTLRADRGYRPVPSVPFHYNLYTAALEAEPIPGLCGDFIIAFGHREDFLPDDLSVTFLLRLPENSFITILDQYMDLLKKGEPKYVLLYEKAGKKLVYKRYNETTWKYSINIYVPQAKRIVFGTTGNYQLLLDLKHDDRPVVNIGSEYVALTSRPTDEYKFTKNYVNKISKPKQLVLGVPAKTPTETKWRIRFGEANSYTGDKAENALIVDDVLLAHFLREENDMRITFKPSKRGENRWKITVKKGKQRIHRATVEGANILAYHEGLVRSSLYDLENGEKEEFDLYDVWKQKMSAIEGDIISEANRCR